MLEYLLISLGGGASEPKVAPAPAPTPVPEDITEGVAKADDETRNRMKRLKGRASTILTNPSSLGNAEKNVKSLLG